MSKQQRSPSGGVAHYRFEAGEGVSRTVRDKLLNNACKEVHGVGHARAWNSLATSPLPITGQALAGTEGIKQCKNIMHYLSLWVNHCNIQEPLFHAATQNLRWLHMAPICSTGH